MEKTIKVINQMQSEGLFDSYAIGGGIAALFYIEPITTFDLDIFIVLPESKSRLVSLSPLYSWLEERGYRPEKEQIAIEGVPVQFIPVYNDLVEDAVSDSMEKRYGETVTRVVRPEYLLAIMLQTLRNKDKDRILKFIEEAEMSESMLEDIMEKYDLKKTFDGFKDRFHEK